MAIKRTKNQEATIAQMLSTKEMRKDPRNHCVPIIEVIKDPKDERVSYMVMPLLRWADMPPFQYMEEIVDFVDQILEVLTNDEALIQTQRDWCSFTRRRSLTGNAFVSVPPCCAYLQIVIVTCGVF